MAYSGFFTPKNPNKYKGDHKNIVYRSLWERNCMRWCDTNSSVKFWQSEEIQIPYVYDLSDRYHRYFPDLFIEFNDGRKILVEIKPKKETVPPQKTSRRTKRYIQESMTYVKNQNKWVAAEKYAKKRGWEFQIWTEDTLRSMGLLQKKMKKLPAMKKPSKKNK
jgi:hypothetical protein